MNYHFYLNDIEVEEPIGFDDFELSMKRDDTYHGMLFEASTGPLRFWGAGGAYLIAQKAASGIFANTIFRATQDCDGVEENVVIGRLNFGKYKASCGNVCTVELPLEEQGCKVTFKNRFDQKVDVENTIGMDGMTPLPYYTQLGQIITMPAVALDTRVEGYVSDVVDTTAVWPYPVYYFVTCSQPGSFSEVYYLRPQYLNEKFNAIDTGQLRDGNDCNYPDPITPQFLFEELSGLDSECFNDTFLLEARFKGDYLAINNGSANTVDIRGEVLLWDGNGRLDADAVILQQAPVVTAQPFNAQGFFDISFNVTITLDQLKANPGLYVVLTFIPNVQQQITATANFYPESFFRLSTKRTCPDSDSQYYMVHETLSRVAENITNKCIRVKSSYYGRIDSQPFAFDQDGCGSLRMLTSGLKLRKAPNGKFFVSMKELIEGLNAIDNIGFDIIEDADIPNRFILRIEPVSFFYQNFEMLSIDAIADSENEIQEAMHYSKINIGYEKWEVENLNGLQEYNSNREYRTGADTINNTKELRSKLIAGGITIEITRQQSFADTGAADTSYDNETFVVCLKRNAYQFVVEQGNILDDQNIFDPPTSINFRITPIRNLLRWFRSIANTYPDLGTSASKLSFNAGTGNFIAIGLLDDNSACRLENATISEEADIWLPRFANPDIEATPLWKNETDSFEYPLSIAQWNKLKGDPYGYISYTCGDSIDVVRGFIKEIKYRPARGMANFSLIRKWE